MTQDLAMFAKLHVHDYFRLFMPLARSHNSMYENKTLCDNVRYL